MVLNGVWKLQNLCTNASRGGSFSLRQGRWDPVAAAAAAAAAAAVLTHLSLSCFDNNSK